MARRTDVALSKDCIQVAAFALLDEEGLDNLTMRAVAKRLKVHAPSLYSYYRDKSELVAAMASKYFIDATTGIDACDSANAWLRSFGLRFYNVLIENRDAARLFAIAEPQVHLDMVTGEEAAGPLIMLGFSLERAAMAQAAIIALALGSAVDHSNEKRASYLNSYFDLERGVHEALGILADGLARTPR